MIPNEDIGTEGPSSIPLYLINGVATVWDPQIAATLHCLHNISGLRTGTLPGVSQQNAFLGLPLILMSEETAYLISEKIAHLIPVQPISQLPSKVNIETQTLERVRKLEELAKKTEQAKERKIKMGRERMEKGGEEVKRKREERAKLKALKLLKGKDQEEKENIKVEKGKVDITNPHFHSIPSHPLSPLSSLSLQSPITSLPHPLFPFPSTPRDHALLATFKTLQKKGFRMGLGPRFGGEYLIYPGDYLRYHAHFTSQVILPEDCIKPSELVAWGRLGTGTKKAGLLCCWTGQRQAGDKKIEEIEGTSREAGKKENGNEGEDEEEVEFYSLEWANFG
ncbi:hypothetical protein TREMEDRAFT_31207 [Tremella mesenterica DSM 1558]|uniref:uncharacterized protein n=1 Tax=Tremella mesenterica (strain ATCC 24925 / CBS 8224 / DSM 1558 / NBRC 9311 / NRRL Y-6157 / RJB 2259-6 / UBC 559-6) TaxID=578456 RepID=UPI0003F49F68|nr:uncharacterized protein TREMEDRAFT_31207 [Tremella mesenterica DSM 1558]EIW69025.1 hypothetical protein TREMEDRAFT_31207 [Tremella mesenterica DSM 1558]